jgi:CheY-like chemotaxis protein
MARKILIVEDNPDLSELLATYLNAVGYETSQAGNSTQAISKALIERPDVIVTDLNLPDMTAIEATEILKQNPLTSAIPIVVLTATSLGEWKDKARKAGVAEYLIKPIPPPALAEVLRNVIATLSHLNEL